MKFEELLSKNKIEKVEKTEFESKSVEKDIEFAKAGMTTENYSRVMSVAYEAVLRAINKLMNCLGYRAIGKEHHKNAFEFIRKLDLDQNQIDFFDKIRVKRNNFVYRDTEEISKQEAEEIIENAEDFVHKIRTFVQENRTGDKDDD
jgi:uncharacterized protein (UPF0332 family)